MQLKLKPDAPKAEPDYPYETFEGYVFSLFDQHKTDTEEFQKLVRLWGREKMKEIWEKYKSLKSSIK